VTSDDALIIALPAPERLAQGNEARAVTAHWWRVADGRVGARGVGIDSVIPPVTGATAIIGLAPVSAVALHRLSLPAATERQAAAAARVELASTMVTPPEAMHVAVSVPHPDGTRSAALVANGAMAAWLDWCSVQGVEPVSLLPVGLLNLPGPATHITIGEEAVMATDEGMFVNDPAMTAMLLPAGTQITDAEPARIEGAMLSAIDTPVINLRSGAWAAKAGPLVAAGTWRRALTLIAATLIISLAIPLATLVRTMWDMSRLDSEAAAAASTALGNDVGIATAQSALDRRIAETGRGNGGVTSPLAALTRTMADAPTVAVDQLTWRGDGVLNVTLGATRAEEINPVLIALQNAGYRITAQPRQGSDGRALGDITIRTAP
jgi:general secretion pathway protein L